MNVYISCQEKIILFTTQCRINSPHTYNSSQFSYEEAIICKENLWIQSRKTKSLKQLTSFCNFWASDNKTLKCHLSVSQRNIFRVVMLPVREAPVCHSHRAYGILLLSVRYVTAVVQTWNYKHQSADKTREAFYFCPSFDEIIKSAALDVRGLAHLIIIRAWGK